VPEGVKNIDLLETSGHLAPAEIDPAQLAADYVKHLEQHPLDTRFAKSWRSFTPTTTSGWTWPRANWNN